MAADVLKSIETLEKGQPSLTDYFGTVCLVANVKSELSDSV